MTRDIAAERRSIDAAVEGQTVVTLFEEAVGSHPDVAALRWKQDGAWQTATWGEYGQLVRDASLGLIAMGLRRGEFVNIISGNRPEYNVADLAVMFAGGTPVSLYNTLAPEQLEYIVNHCEAVFVIAENRGYYEKFLKIKQALPRVKKVIMLEGADEFAGDDWVISWDEVVSAGRDASANAAELEKRMRAVKPEDVCTLIYTSGTTGPPKGVVVTHRNVCWTAESVNRVFPRTEGMRHISYLPMAHIAERMVGHYLHIKGASTVSFCPDAREIGKYLADVRPQFFFAVPRIWEKLHSGLMAVLRSMPEEQSAPIRAALDARLERVRLEQAGKPVPAELAKAADDAEGVTVLVRKQVGLDEVEIAGTGAAPISPEILEFFFAIGVRVAEVYGQSEDTGPTSWNPPDRIKIGTVGPTIPGVEVKLADDGELLVKGGNLTGGYFKEPELTAETFDDEGWLHSGDVAEIDEDGYIRIVDRKKEILITAGGKNIAPSNIETLLKQKPLIGQAAAIGDRRPYVTALVVLDPEAAVPWAKSKGLPTDLRELARRPELIDEVQSYVDDINTRLHNQEQVKKFTVLPDEWTVDTEELTPSLKMKRKVVNTKYADQIEAMYS